MDFQQACRLIEQSIKDMTQKVSCRLGESEESIIVSIISSRFDGMTIKQRFNLIWQTLSENEPSLISEFLLSFELWTDSEFQQLPQDEQSKMVALNEHTERVASPL